MESIEQPRAMSGSMILMMLGYYQPLLSSVNHFLRSMAVLDFSSAWAQFLILLPFCLGILIGLFLCAKIIDALLKRFGPAAYCAVLGLVLSSPIAILTEIPQENLTPSNILSAVVLFSLCLIFTCWYSKKEDGG